MEKFLFSHVSSPFSAYFSPNYIIVEIVNPVKLLFLSHEYHL